MRAYGKVTYVDKTNGVYIFTTAKQTGRSLIEQRHNIIHRVEEGELAFKFPFVE